MKKWLAILVGTTLVFAMATASLAASIKGDFRYDMYEDKTNTVDNSYETNDLRLTVAGDVSSTVSAMCTSVLSHTCFCPVFNNTRLGTNLYS